MDAALHIREKGLKVTPSRLSVINEMTNSHQAYSHADLEAIFTGLDRVTLYRVLKDFEEAGLVHKIIDLGGVTRFGLCSTRCPDAHHADSHVHFNCQGCNKMYCLEHTPAPQISVPAGFKPVGFNTVVFGLCKNCNAA